MGGWGDGWCAGSWRGGGGEGGDSTSPSVFDFTPADGRITPSTRIGFKAVDETALRRVIVIAYFDALRTWEVVYDGEAFAPEYETYSTVTAGTFSGLPGYEFSLRRYHGWPGNPRIKVRAYDQGGNEAA